MTDEKRETKPRYSQRPESMIQLNVAARFRMDEFQSWKPDKVKAFMQGIALIIARQERKKGD